VHLPKWRRANLAKLERIAAKKAKEAHKDREEGNIGADGGEGEARYYDIYTLTDHR
jgi:hypothetical protein